MKNLAKQLLLRVKDSTLRKQPECACWKTNVSNERLRNWTSTWCKFDDKIDLKIDNNSKRKLNGQSCDLEFPYYCCVIHESFF